MPTKSATATNAARATVDSGGRVPVGKERERDEGEKPRDVEVEPVRQHELEADQERTGEGCELKRRLARGKEGKGDRPDDEEPLEHPLHDAKIG